MRKVILGVAVSLDGLIEGPNGEYDWCFLDQDYGMKDFQGRIDSIFYGRKSYEVMLKECEKSGPNPFADKKSYVFSNTLKQIAGAEIVSGDLTSTVNALKHAKGKDVWLYGGAVLTTNLMNAGLVDELWLAVHPILLGSGKPLFQGLQRRVKTKLLDSKTYSTGLISLSYQIE